jgi:serum/glucocorticoid-regulated kinase 2
MPKHPPLIKGRIMKVNVFKVIMYPRYLIVDPESGILARYKDLADVPWNPKYLFSIYQFQSELIAL